MQSHSLQVIARIESSFPAKFGVPRQSGLVPELSARVVFEPAFRNPDALRGLDGFSHLWLIWQFSEAVRSNWSPTVRPPRLGGNARMGVFATRSPFRPNPLGLSCVELLSIQYTGKDAPALTVGGADLVHGTPIYDIKPYLAYADARPEARCGFASSPSEPLRVVISPEAEAKIPPDTLPALRGVLAQDPRPHYQNDPERVYGMAFDRLDVRFRVVNRVLTVTDVLPRTTPQPDR